MSGDAGATRPVPPQSIVLVGMMGAGKTSIGRRLARTLDWPFVDADTEIELAAGTSIANIFAEIGEEAFRESEHHVIARLLDGPKRVLALGGGGFVDGRTRALVREKAISVWLSADLDVLVRRTSRRNDRPLLQGVDPRARLAGLLEARAPVYAEADLEVDSTRGSIRAVVEEILTRIAERPVGGIA